MAATGVTIAQATAACQTLTQTMHKLNKSMRNLGIMMLASDRPGWARWLQQGNDQRFETWVAPC